MEQGIVFCSTIARDREARFLRTLLSLFSLHLADEDLNGLFDDRAAVIGVRGSACLRLRIETEHDELGLVLDLVDAIGLLLEVVDVATSLLEGCAHALIEHFLE